MDYTITTQQCNGSKQVVLAFKQAAPDGTTQEIRSVVHDNDHDLALLVVLIESLKLAAEDLQPGLYSALPPEDEAVTADAMRIQVLAQELRTGRTLQKEIVAKGGIQ